MAQTIRNAKVNGTPRANYLLESKRLETLDKGIRKAYGLVFDYNTLKQLDQKILKAIDNMLR